MAIPKRIAGAVLNSLKGGVVPRVGLEYVQVGRTSEINALLHDAVLIEDGGSAFRFIAGKFGAGKSFLLQTIRNHVMDRGFAVIDADLSPERRFSGTKGQGLATYRELIRNMATKTRPEGGALPLVLEKWLSGIMAEVAVEINPDSEEFTAAVRRRIFTVTNEIEGMVNGFEFAKALSSYYDAYKTGDDEKKSAILRFFRAEYTTKTEAKTACGINFIITDESWYDFIKLFALFLVRAGYKGLYVMIDELAYLYNLHNRTTRQNNYEKILAMYNDAVGGKARYMGIIMGAIPQCIDDTEKGIFSYGALRSRLTEGKFSGEKTGTRDLLAPIIRLKPLSMEEMYVLLEKLSILHGTLYDYAPDIKETEYVDFLKAEYERIGAAEQITPREIIRDFIEVLNILSQSDNMRIGDVLSSAGFAFTPVETETVAEEFADFEV
ncbi:MAG: ATP-binding protein [Ruminococcus sp.]|nr:ATP-binding protein [Ruminococcus sp.]